MRSRKWRAEIQYGDHKRGLGAFSDEWAAANAYNEAAKKYHGSLARLNERVIDEVYDGPD